MSVGYVAYIDEAGDDGLKRVYPMDPNGSSEWFVLACLLVRIENDVEVVKTAREILSRFINCQTKDIHYRNLIPAKKTIACELISQMKARCFVVMSNKKNMENHVNLRAANSIQLYTDHKNWFYWWVARCLLERVTKECETHSISDGKKDVKLRIIFSRRGGMNYSNFREYMKKLRGQSETNRLYNKIGDICWKVIDFDEIHAYDHKSMAGLQLSDVIASAFYQSVAETPTRPCDPQFAKMLRRIVGHKIITAKFGDRYRHYFSYGVKILPSLRDAKLTPQQMRIFDFYRERDWIRKRR